MVDYFGKYSSREEYIVNKWIENLNIGNIYDVQYIRSNTGFHDGILKFKYNGIEKQLIIEVKEDEYFWYKKTGNLGFDFLSAFEFKNEDRKKYYKEKCSNWVSKSDFKIFSNNDINIIKKGKLLTCDADIQLFYVENENAETIIMQAYSNKCLQSKEFLEYIYNNYSLRINNKQDYNIKDSWESAAFFIKKNDSKLKKCELNNIKDYFE